MKKINLNKSEVQIGKIKIIETAFSRIGITKIENQFVVFEDICTHDGEPISEGKLEFDCIECPRHQAKFNLKTGKVLCMPAVEDLHIFKFNETETTLEIEVEDE